MNKPLFLSIVLFTACDTTMTGSQGNLQLSYTHGGLFEQVSQPVAAGLQADTVIRNAATDTEITIAQANSNNTEVIDVLSIEEGRMDLVANAAGQATLSVTSDTGLQDEFTVDVREISTVTFGKPTFSGNSDDFVIATSASIWIPRTLMDEGGESLTGYGIELPTSVPAESAEAREDGAIGSTQVHFRLAGDVEIAAANNEGRTFTVVDIAEVSWSIDMVDGYDGQLPVGASGLVQVEGTDSIGRTALSDIVSTDETICSVSAFLGSAESYIVTAIAEGVCDLVLPGDDETIVLSYNITNEDS